MNYSITIMHIYQFTCVQMFMPFASILCDLNILVIKHYILRQVLLQFTYYRKWQNMLGFYSFSVNEISFQRWHQVAAR